jgi:WD40 repeat protein
MNNYQIALSFAGEQRPLVSAVAERLAACLGRDEVFYDRFHEAELARPNLDLYLQEIYHVCSRLVVVFLGRDYDRKDWCGLEWRAVRDLIKSKKSEQIMLVRVDEGEVPGVFGIDGYVDARGRNPCELADLILERLRLLSAAPTVSERAVDHPAATGVTVVPKPPPHYLARPEDLTVLKAMLLGRDATGVRITVPVGVQGMGGIGKSVLAAALARDEAVSAAFPDGVFWVAVGQHPDLVQLQVELAAVAGGVNAVVESPRQGKLLLSRLLGRRSVLLVLDDLWKLEDATAFDVLGPGGRLLITTRDADLLVALGAEEYTVEVLSGDQANILLADWAGQEAADLPLAARRVGQTCGYLPLALAMIGAMVRHRPGGWADAMCRLERADLDKIRRTFPDYPYPDLLRALEVSVEALELEERERFLEFAVFPKAVAVPESVLETLWAASGLAAADARDLCAKLVARSLAQRDPKGRLRLHDLQADYLRHKAGDLRQLHGRLVDAYAARSPEGLSRGADDGYFFQQLPWHLRGAGRLGELRKLLLHYSWLEAKLAATEINALLSDYDALLEDPELRLVQDALRLSAHALVEHPEELPGQLYGRLRDRREEGVARLLDGVLRSKEQLWIRPLTASLTPPGGTLVRTLAGHSAPVNAVAVLPGGRVVSGSDDGTVRAWDLISGTTLQIFEGHWARINAVAVVSDGRVVSGSDDGTLRVWDLISGTTLHTLKGHSDRVTAVAALPDGRIVSAADDCTLRVWDLVSRTAIEILEGPPINAVAVLGDGRIVSGCSDSTLWVSDLASARTLPLETLKRRSAGVNAVAPLADGRVVSISNDGVLRVWDPAARTLLQTLNGHLGRALAALPSGRVVSASSDGTLRVWDLASGKIIQTFEGSHGVNAVAVLPDGSVVSACDDSTLRVWGPASGRSLQTLERHLRGIDAVGVLPDGHVVSAADSTLRVWDLASGTSLQIVEGGGYRHGFLAVGVLLDGRVVTCSVDRTLRVWDLASGATLMTLEGHSHWVLAVAALPDGRVVSASADCTLRVWDLASGRSVLILKGHSDWVTAVAVLPGNRVVSGSHDRTLRVWDLVSGQALQIFEGHSFWVEAVVALSSGRVVSASRDGSLRVWDLATGNTLHTLVGHSQGVQALAVLPDGGVVSASDDRTLRVWNEGLGQTVAWLTLDASPSALGILADSGQFIVGDQAGRLHAFRLEGAPNTGGTAGEEDGPLLGASGVPDQGLS